MALSDAEIRKRIVDDLSWDTSIDASKVLVKVDRGQVTLAGTVPSYTARNRATDAAYRIPDVIWVDNQLIVKYPQAVLVPSDADIRQSVVDNLACDSDLDRTDIRVLVKSCTVTLEGSVDEYWKKGEAERIACRTRGVCDIINDLTVVPTRSVLDKMIAEDVRSAIGRNLNGRSEDMTIEVVNGVVTLSGTVPGWVSRRAAVNAAEYTRGVVDVIDDLVIASPGRGKAVGQEGR